MKIPKYEGDPRGHSARVYDDVYDSPAFKSLSPHDVLAYLALLRQLRQWNNGDLSLPLSESKKRGIKHSQTLAQSLRALCAVGLVEISRQGGSRKGGQRLPNLYRVTDRECFDIPKKYLDAKKASDKSIATGKNPDFRVVIRGDREGNARSVSLVMNAAAEAGIGDISFSTASKE